jgi:hypothetical protein
MTEHEELLEFREEKKHRLKRARITALTFGVLAIIALIAFTYAFFQQTAANRARIEAEMNAMVAIESRALADEHAAKFEALANHQTKVIDSLMQACQQTERRSK